MKVAIIGGGITGLTAAYELSKAGHAVSIFEKESYLGGLAYGYKQKGWDWSLEYAYHHLFTSDDAILSLAHELGLSSSLITKRPVTASLYDGKMYQLDSVSSLLSFPGLPFIDRIRTGVFLASLKFNPFWKLLEGYTAKGVAQTIGGNAGWKAIWEPLLVGKFGNYADSIAASWLWARIKKRTPSLVYFDGGFQTFIHRLEEQIKKQHGIILKNTAITGIQHTDSTEQQFKITYGKKTDTFDKVLITAPTPLASKLLQPLTTHNPQLTTYFKQPLTIPHLFAQVLVLETKEPILKNVYWLNITDRSFPFLAVVAHTNYMDKSHYGGNHITYVGNYLPIDHPFITMKKEAVIKKFLPYLKKLNPSLTYLQLTTQNPQLFTAPFAQPVHERNYSSRAPALQTPVPGLFLANMDSIYPWDRGTNYAVELGQRVAELIKIPLQTP